VNGSPYSLPLAPATDLVGEFGDRDPGQAAESRRLDVVNDGLEHGEDIATDETGLTRLAVMEASRRLALDRVIYVGQGQLGGWPGQGCTAPLAERHLDQPRIPQPPQQHPEKGGVGVDTARQFSRGHG